MRTVKIKFTDTLKKFVAYSKLVIYSLLKTLLLYKYNICCYNNRNVDYRSNRFCTEYLIDSYLYKVELNYTERSLHASELCGRDGLVRVQNGTVSHWRDSLVVVVEWVNMIVIIKICSAQICCDCSRFSIAIFSAAQ